MHGGGWMRFVRIAGVVVVALMIAPPVSAAPATRAVSIPGFYFSPQTIRIHLGDTVRWTNTSKKNHSVQSNSDSPESFRSSSQCPGGLFFNDCIRPGESYEFTFNKLGVHTYRDPNHGADRPFPDCGMCGRVIVVRKSSPTSSPSAGASPTGSGSPSVSPSPTGSNVSSGSPSPGSSTLAAGPSASKKTPTLAIAAVGIALLAGTGAVVYRTMIRRT